MTNHSVEHKTIEVDELPALFDTIEALMQRVEQITEQATNDHLAAFAAQMREKFGADAIILDEPYLPELQAFLSLRFLVKLEQLMQKLEQGAGNDRFRTTIFNLNEPIAPQLQSRLQLETVRHQLEAKQELDKTRQQQFGVKKYIWRTAGDDKVRTSHAELEGKIFAWDENSIKPGEEPGCRCSAEPVLDSSGIDDPPIEPVYPLEELIIILAGGGVARRVGQKILERVGRSEEVAPKPQKPLPTPKKEPQDILNPNGQPIGKPGNRPEVRVENGGEKAARDLYDKLAKGGTPETPSGYPGEGTRLPNGDWVGYRSTSKSGAPSIDLDVNGFPYRKIKFP